MKKYVALLAAAGLMAAATAAFGASIVNSKHDLSNGSLVGGNASAYTMGSSTQICIYCHAPHYALESLPLWNRTNPSGAGFTLYSGLNMENVSFKTGLTSDSTSLFCMSCHDGVTGIQAVFNAGVIDGNTSDKNHGFAAGTFTRGGGTGGALAGANSGNLTKDLSKTHPINFVVAETNTQTDLWPGTGPEMSGSTYGTKFPLFKSTHANADRTTANRSLECGSCHAVHDSAYQPFLRDTMGKSRLCLGCHNK